MAFGNVLNIFYGFIIIQGYRCSAGVAHNKILAKLVCGLHKPNKQTILPQDAVPLLYKDLPVKKIKGFGGKFGKKVSQLLNIRNMGELSKFSERELARHFDEKAANWLYNISRGIDHETVTMRLISKSIGCSKNFLGRNALVSQESVDHWLKELVSELSERLKKDLEENNRKAKTITINFSHATAFKNVVIASRTCQINSYDQGKLTDHAREVLNRNCRQNDGTYKITHLGFSMGSFENVKNVRDITSFFKSLENTKKDNQKPEEKIKVNYSNEDQNSPKLKTNGELDCQKIKVETLSKDLSSFDQAKLLESSTFLESDTDSSDDDDSSVFSIATTFDNKNNKDKLIYLESVRPESVLDQNFPVYENKANVSSSSADSITSEICQTQQIGLVENRPPSSSFFEKYFSDRNFKRDFDTSKMLKENTEIKTIRNEDLEEENKNKEMEISVKSQEKLGITNDFSGSSPLKKYNSPQRTEASKYTPQRTTSNITQNVAGKKNCSKCDKSIALDQIASHMDYHFALKLVQSEAHVYLTQSNNNIPKSPVKNNTQETKSSTKNLKRKSNEATDSMAPISKFFKKIENPEDISEGCELCRECNKRIKVEDLPSHFDYHAAKKLHLELNSQRSKPKSPVRSKTINAPKIEKKPKLMNSGVNIASFFFKK